MCFQGKGRNLSIGNYFSPGYCPKMGCIKRSHNKIMTCQGPYADVNKSHFFQVNKVSHFGLNPYISILFSVYSMCIIPFLYSPLQQPSEDHRGALSEPLQGSTFFKTMQSVGSCVLPSRCVAGTKYTHTSGPVWTHPSADTDRQTYTSSFRILTWWERERAVKAWQLKNSMSTKNEISCAIPRRSLSWCVCVCVRVLTPGSDLSVCVLSEGFFGFFDWHIQRV